MNISRLRTVLEPERTGRGESTVLLTREPGYVLAVDAERVDLLCFEQALSSARSDETGPHRVLELLDQGLGLWRGDAFADFAYEAFARQAVDRLTELRLEALELRFEARLRLGQDAELTSEIETLSRESPFREHPVAQLMTALYRAGRQAEALRAYERHRRTLAEELGIEPSSELRRPRDHDQRLSGHAGETGAATTCVAVVRVTYLC